MYIYIYTYTHATLAYHDTTYIFEVLVCELPFRPIPHIVL